MNGLQIAYKETRSVVVEAPARLHLGFMDLNGATGHRFGSLGLTLEGFSTRIYAERAEMFSVEGAQTQRAMRVLRHLHERLKLRGAVRMAVVQAIPEHIGLGSGTQLAIASGIAVARLYQLDLGAREIAAVLDRGIRSGIGIGAFDQGGFLIDGGRGNSDEPPRITSRIAFPSQWRVLLVLDLRAQGLHGADEDKVFRTLPQFPDASAAYLCRLVLMHLMPALVEADIQEFGKAVSELQRVVGDYFAPAQGGRYASHKVSEVLAWLESQGVNCVGQSSWGPTGFAVVDSEIRASSLLQEAEARWGADSKLRFKICAARNRGGEVLQQQRSIKTGTI
ncbi:MAG TPA: beta-ribofuranosylaminobenzene 5'-phosphate synthase family protein [Burkholderiales bacterium]|nr:beta-ribofuranosylaminobenzene 5'-phosphate synthase family protein [Burkholderiales bacterium]